jgi:hypothetical protein
MQISRNQLKDLRELIEDSVEYTCDQEMLSGQTAWTVVQCLAQAKVAELEGRLVLK